MDYSDGHGHNYASDGYPLECDDGAHECAETGHYCAWCGVELAPRIIWKAA